MYAKICYHYPCRHCHHGRTFLWPLLSAGTSSLRSCSGHYWTSSKRGTRSCSPAESAQHLSTSKQDAFLRLLGSVGRSSYNFGCQEKQVLSQNRQLVTYKQPTSRSDGLRGASADCSEVDWLLLNTVTLTDDHGENSYLARNHSF